MVRRHSGQETRCENETVILETIFKHFEWNSLKGQEQEHSNHGNSVKSDLKVRKIQKSDQVFATHFQYILLIYSFALDNLV